MSEQKIRVGVIGSGGIAGLHLSILAKRLDDVELMTVVDVREDAARAAAEKYGVQRPGVDYESALAGDVDAVLICVPTYLHADIACAALRAGKAVFCQKPMARTMAQAEAMAQAAAESGAPLQIGFVRRFDDEWLAFRDAVQAGKIGRPVIWHDVSSGPGPSSAWYCVDEQGGGPFLDGCIHNIDFALHTFGPAEAVFTHAATFRHEGTALDTGTAVVKFVSGDELMLAWSWGLPAGCSGARVFELLGPEGTMTWPGEKPADPDRRAFVINRGSDQREQILYPSNALTTAFEREMDEFISVSRGQRQPRAGAREGCESLQVALAILESGRSGEGLKIAG